MHARRIYEDPRTPEISHAHPARPTEQAQQFLACVKAIREKYGAGGGPGAILGEKVMLDLGRGDSPPADVPVLPNLLAPLPPPVVVAEAKRLFEHATKTIARNIDATLQLASRALAPLDGLPPAVEGFSVLGVETREASYQGVLAWLFDRYASHGMSDLFVRRFLAALGVTLRGSIFDHSLPLPLECASEFQLATPHGHLGRWNSSRSDFVPVSSLRMDLLLVSPDTWVAIECKVVAEESLYRVDDEEFSQASVYRHVLRQALGITKCASVTTSGALRKSLEHALAQRFGRAFAARSINPRRILSCVIDGKPVTSESYVGRGGPYHLNWACTARLAALLAAERGVVAAVRRITDDFFAASCRLAADGELLSTIENVRLRTQAPLLARKSPVRTILELQRAMKMLHQHLPPL